MRCDVKEGVIGGDGMHYFLQGIRKDIQRKKKSTEVKKEERVLMRKDKERGGQGSQRERKRWGIGSDSEAKEDGRGETAARKVVGVLEGWKCEDRVTQRERKQEKKSEAKV